MGAPMRKLLKSRSITLGCAKDTLRRAHPNEFIVARMHIRIGVDMHPTSVSKRSAMVTATVSDAD